VILGDPKREKNEGMLRALGRFIQQLGGLYWTGVDVGTTVTDMDIVRAETSYELIRKPRSVVTVDTWNRGLGLSSVSVPSPMI
jgi:glutamate dehydrogenase/leucine dehydrogenase